jgi:signal transduction histidine kinase
MRRFIILRVVFVLVFVSGLVAAVLLCSEVIRRKRAEVRSTTAAEGRRIALHVQKGVLAATEPLKRLGQWWLTQGKPAAREDWATDGQLFLSQSPGLSEALWVGMDGRQWWSAVPGATPNTTVTRPDNKILREIATLRNGQPTAISEVFISPGAGPAIYVCFPVSQGHRVRGYVVGLYAVRALVSAIANGATLREQRITIAAGGRQIYTSGPAAQRGEEHASAALPLANQVWTLELIVPLYYFQEFRGLTVSIIGVVGALTFSFIMLLVLSKFENSAEQLRRLSRKLSAAHEDERLSISRELHDEVGQVLTALRTELGNVEEYRYAPGSDFADHLGQAKNLAEDTLRTVRNMSAGLRPSVLDQLGLAPALQWQAREFTKRSGVPVAVHVDGELRNLPDSYRTCIYRVAQEALTNCARHANAKLIRVNLHGGPEMLSLTVEDDGVGFDVEKVRNRGIGLLGIEERVRELGGSMVLRSQLSRGSLLRCEIPAPREVIA